MEGAEGLASRGVMPMEAVTARTAMEMKIDHLGFLIFSSRDRMP